MPTKEKLIANFNYTRAARYYPADSGKIEHIAGAIVVGEGYHDGSVRIDRLGDTRNHGALELDSIEEVRILRRLLTSMIRMREAK